ncbi:MAG: FAD-binding oxidoreductase [Dehalococcoidia bacterium]
MDPTSGLEALRHAVPADTERGPRAYAIDGITPAIAFSPDDRTEVAALLRAADGAGLVVAPQGGRTALGLGRPLDRYDVAVELAGLARVVEYVPDDLTVTVEAGMHLDALQATLGEHGQYLPVDPAPDDHVSVGGLLATARSGAWRGHLPAARDLVLGATVALPSGAVVRSGGRVVKNVTGYDAHRMHTGALGVLGVIVEASFKVAPLPAVTRTLVARCATVAEAAALARRMWDGSLAARAISILTPEAAAHAALGDAPGVLLDLAGSAAAVDRSAREVVDAAPHADEAPVGAWTRLRQLHGDADATVVRLGVPPTRLRETVEAVRAAGCVTWAHVAAGAVIGHAGPDTLDAPAIEALRAFAVHRAGFLQVEGGPAALRRAVDPFAAGETELVRALKAQFDPRGTLNRGRWMEGV